MKNTAKSPRLSADEIAEKAMCGENISPYFTNKGEMKPAIQGINVDFTLDMLKELDTIARELNISRQAVIKTYLRQSLDQHYLARRRGAGDVLK
ncbi:MAG: CopG family transcriptional regulator [Deltaproteobacteria bacterium]|nr:CopG family transcriptional regulator [Deltaproteobacteria bacterium]